MKDLFDPRPEFQKEQGFEPNFYIRFLRWISKVIILFFRLNGKTRFSNEFIQALDPQLSVSLERGDEIIFRTGHGRLYWRAKHGYEEEPMLLEWINSWSSDEVFLDVGANIGTYTLYAAKRGIKTIACEVDLINANLLYQNVFLNQLEEKVLIFSFAVGEETTIKNLFLKDVSPGDALHALDEPSYMLNKRQSIKEIDVPCFKVDDLVSILNIQPTKMKVDTDSNEFEVLLGADGLLDTINEIYIELDEKYEKHQKAITYLMNKGFTEKKREAPHREWSEVGNVLWSKG